MAVILGTRPEVVKLAGVIRLLGEACRLIHTGQHYDEKMSRVFLDDFDLPEPDIAIEVGGESRGRQIADAVGILDRHFDEEPPLAVVVQGDTNTTLAGALAANARGIPIVHVEAGLRSFDRLMPEEHNRVLTDHLADLCCAPTETSRQNLLSESIPDERIVVTGNTVVEAVEELLPVASERDILLKEYALTPASYVLATFHRPENVDDPGRLRRVLEVLGELPVPVVLPVHPRTRHNLELFELEGLLGALSDIEPLDYRTFLAMSAEAALLVTDSGGIQEEASVLKRPVVVVRNSTERPEVLGTFARLVPLDMDIVGASTEWLRDPSGTLDALAAIPSPYGDGSASARTIAAIGRLLGV